MNYIALQKAQEELNLTPAEKGTLRHSDCNAPSRNVHER